MARPIPPAVRDRLTKLMLLLGSTNEGESSAAAGRITVLLKANGLDWHDLVGSIGDMARSAPQPPPTKSKPPAVQRGQHVMDEEEFRALMRRILRSPLNARARNFLTALEEIATMNGEIRFSTLQWVWFQDLVRKAGAA